MAKFLSKLNLFAQTAAPLTADDPAWLEVSPLPMALVDKAGVVLASNKAWSVDIGLRSIGPDVGRDILLQDGSLVRPSLAASAALDHDIQVCTMTDISDLRPETTSAARPDFYRSMLDMFEDCVKVVDPSGRLLFLNEAGRRVLKVSPTQQLGMKWVDLLPPAAGPKVEQILEQVLAGEATQFSNHSQFPGEEPQTWHHILTPYRDGSGHVIAALCVSRDVTCSHGSQEATRQSEERLAKAAEAAGLGIWDIDLRSGRVHCNDVWYKVMGISSSVGINSMAQFLGYVHPDDVERISSHWHARENAFDQKGEYAVDFRVVDDARKIRQVRATAAIIRDLSDHPVRAVGFVSTGA